MTNLNNINFQWVILLNNITKNIFYQELQGKIPQILFFYPAKIKKCLSQPTGGKAICFIVL